MELNEELARAFTLDGRVVVITGAGSGLGQETARILSLAGARTILVDIDEAGLAQTAALIAQAGPAATPGPPLLRTVDVSSRQQVDELADWAVSETGRLDVWVNAAGISYLHTLLTTDPGKADRIIAINMMGPYWGSVSAARVMSERGGGSIVNISSAGGSMPLPGIGLYGMTKAAVNSLTWTSATEFGPLGVRVNAIAPGWIETPMSSIQFLDESGQFDPERRDKVLHEMAATSPMGLLGRPLDIAHAVLFLATDASRYLTGQILGVNGGASM
jgi:3-oxoacyl-[acyl-carrier protein] reductase